MALPFLTFKRRYLLCLFKVEQVSILLGSKAQLHDRELIRRGTGQQSAAGFLAHKAEREV
jgi:hypothetical protein